MTARRRAAATLWLVLAVLTATCVAPAPLGPWHPEGLPGGEPPAIFGGRLAIGLRNDPGDLDWMVSSGIPWAARYTYLAGGVNTGEGWTTWSAEPGGYAAAYARESLDAGFVPILTYYQLQQSRPGSGTTGAQRDLANLNDAATMRAYYEDFAVLMRALANLPRSAIVHVEPDLWGYLQQRNGDPTKIPVRVRSSGHPDVGSEPDTAAGFAHALVALRDRYAPRVLLALHASAWSAGRDLIVSTMDVDVQPLASATARFLLATGAGHGWDLMFHDMVDRDAGMATPTAGRRSWWDPEDRSVPDFARWLRYVHALSVALNERLIVWQVPIGNQRYRTMDNTPGHYQDTRAEYFMAHPDLLAAAGIAAVLFGPGVPDATWYLDARKDGITNPDPVIAFGCDRCNATVAELADDDGGFLRIAAGAYYRRGAVVLPRP